MLEEYQLNEIKAVLKRMYIYTYSDEINLTDLDDFKTTIEIENPTYIRTIFHNICKHYSITQFDFLDSFLQSDLFFESRFECSTTYFFNSYFKNFCSLDLMDNIINSFITVAWHSLDFDKLERFANEKQQFKALQEFLNEDYNEELYKKINDAIDKL